MNKFKEGDKVMWLGMVGEVTTVYPGGYLVDFPNTTDNFVYESELVGINELEDDRGKNRTFNGDND